MKKIFLLLLSLALVFLLASCDDMGSDDVPTRGIQYRLSSDGTYAEVVGFRGLAFKRVIADTYKDVPVKAIAPSAFKDDFFMTLVIPSSVESIGAEAFSECSALKTIRFKGVSRLDSIGDEAFYSCTSLTSITIPSSVTYIGFDAFSDCWSLEAVHIEDLEAWCNTSFGIFRFNFPFSNATNPLHHADNLYLNGELVTELVIPEGVTSISHGAFYHCASITSSSM